MEDPWSTGGGGWGPSAGSSSTSPPAQGQQRLPGEELRNAPTPPPNFDVGDPWGIATPAQALSLPTSPPPIADSPSRVHHVASEDLGWGSGHEHGDGNRDSHGGWAAGPSSPKTVASPKAPLPPAGKDASEPEHDAVWSLNSPAAAAIPLPPDLNSDAPIPHISSAGPSTPPPAPPHASRPTSPTSVHSHHTSHSLHSLHNLDPGEGFASASFDMGAIPRSPSFGVEDFGGFSTGPAFGTSGDADPWGPGLSTGVGIAHKAEESMPSWGGKEDVDDWAGDMSFESGTGTGQVTHDVRGEEEVAGGDDDDSEDGWGGVRSPVQPNTARDRDRGEEEWEEAQRRIRIKQERAPQEKIDGLIKAWTELGGNIAVSDLPKMTGAEELQYDGTVKRASEDVFERLRSLSIVPPDINTYPPVVSNLVTHERYAYALTRPNPVPSTSFLTAAARARPRRIDHLSHNLSLAGPSSGESWTNRSRLGEPDAPADMGAAAPSEENKSRWSFWGRRPAVERQLTTSGGGMLEVKSSAIGVTPDTSAAASPAAGTQIALPRSSSRTASIASKPSRPTSPALMAPIPSLAPAPSLSPSLSLPPSTSHESVGHASPSGLVDQTPPPQAQPSAVSRFFGRLSRKPSAVQTDEDGIDLELSADDFSFLAEVPSITSPPSGQGVEDLLALEDPIQPARSLGTVLQNAALSKPLAPPPARPSLYGIGSQPASRSASGSGKFVARMKSPTTPTQAQAPTDFDLLGDLDFAAPPTLSSSTLTMPNGGSGTPSAPAASQHGQKYNATWDDFLSFDSPASSGPSRSAELASTAQSGGGGGGGGGTGLNKPTPPIPAHPATPTLSLSPPPPTQPSAFPTASLGLPFDAPPATPRKDSFASDSNGFGETDDFGTPQPASGAKFDDFGDFSAFDDPSFASLAPAPALGSAANRNHQHEQAPAPAIQALPKPRPLSAFVQSATPTYSSSTPTSKPAHVYSTPQSHARGPSLDHTPTLNLVTNASASRGKRWPAPPSPVPQVLEPPPRASSNLGVTAGSNGGGFPFLSPPPASGRPVSRTNNLLDEPEATEESSTASSAAIGSGSGEMALSPNATGRSSGSIPPPVTSTTTIGGGLMLGESNTPPLRSLTSTPLSSMVASPPKQKQSAQVAAKVGSGAGRGGGLSAQDLSFFDSF